MENLIETSVKIILTIVLCGLIGIEREYRQKMAGLRTHILVGVGSALVVLTSMYMFDIYKDATIMDPTRMGTGIVTGIGFLCAGTIIKAGDHVRGLTTAATLWLASCVGIAVGAGQYAAGIICTLVVLLVLTVVRSIEESLGEKFKEH